MRQTDLSDFQNIRKKRKRTRLETEGYCESCGNYDILQEHEGLMLCEECRRL